MSYKKAKWAVIASGKAASNKVGSFGRNIQAATKTLTALVSKIDEAMRFVESFLQTYIDPVAPFIEKIRSLFIAYANDILGIGGGVIFITPKNRMNPRTISFRASQPGNNNYEFDKVHLSREASNSFYLTIPPIDIPAMSPAEAFLELKNSFNNTNDPFRPRWTPLSTTTGFGILIATADVKGIGPFIKSLEAFANFFDFSDIKETLDGYRKDFSTYAKDLEESMYKSAAQTLRGSGIVADVVEEEYYNENGKFVKSLTLSKYRLQQELPSLHWYGLSVENIPGFRTIVDQITTLLDWALQVTQKVSSAIWELFEIIKKRIYTLVTLVQNVLDAMGAMFSLFYLGDAYAFVVEPEAGGIDHLIQSIQTSIQNPETTEAADVAKIWTTADLSVLMFAAAGAPNRNAWKLLARATLGASEDEEDLSPQFAVSGIVSEGIYPINTLFTLEFVSEDEDINFTYNVHDKEGKILSRWEDYITFKLARNVPLTPFMISEEGEYTLEVTAYSSTYPFDEATATVYPFKVSSLVTSPLLPPIKEAPISLTLADDFEGTVEIRSATTGKTYDKSKIYSGGEVVLGQTLSESGLFDIIITSLDGTSVVSRSVIDSRYPVTHINTLQPKIYVPSLPYAVKFSDFAKVVKIFIDGQWMTISLPGYIIFSEYACFKIRYFQEGTWRETVVCTSATDTSFKNIC